MSMFSTSHVAKITRNAIAAGSAIALLALPMLVPETTNRTAMRERSELSAAPATGRVADAYAKLPLSFEPNLGQTDPAVDFLARGGGYALFLTHGEAVFTLRSAEPATEKRLARRDVV